MELEKVGSGLPVSPGRISGKIALDSKTAIRWSREGERVILVRRDTSPDDYEGMLASVGFLTARGGMTSHASLVARELGRPCVVGCRELRIGLEQRLIGIGDAVLMEGQEITIDGTDGGVYVPA